MNKDIEWLTESLGINKKKQETIIISKFDKEYYRNRYVAAMDSLSEKTTTIVDLNEKIADLQRQLRAAWQLEADAALTLTETSQLDNTGNKNNE